MPMPKRKEKLLGGHAVVAIGYDISLKKFPIEMVKVRNSWGKDWGLNGYFWMPMKFLTSSKTNDFWVIDSINY
jgi:C1A family cysteine protease